MRHIIFVAVFVVLVTKYENPATNKSHGDVDFSCQINQHSSECKNLSHLLGSVPSAADCLMVVADLIAPYRILSFVKPSSPPFQTLL